MLIKLAKDHSQDSDEMTFEEENLSFIKPEITHFSDLECESLYKVKKINNNKATIELVYGCWKDYKKEDTFILTNAYPFI